MIQLYHMDYVTTNIRLFKEDYQRLKSEAALKRKSLSAVIREKLTTEKHVMTQTKVSKVLKDLDQLAQKNAKSLKGFNSIEVLREIRYGGKW